MSAREFNFTDGGGAMTIHALIQLHGLLPGSVTSQLVSEEDIRILVDATNTLAEDLVIKYNDETRTVPPGDSFVLYLDLHTTPDDPESAAEWRSRFPTVSA